MRRPGAGRHVSFELPTRVQQWLGEIAQMCVTRLSLVAHSHPVSLLFLPFSVEWGFPFDPLKVKLLARDLRTAQKQLGLRSF